MKGVMAAKSIVEQARVIAEAEKEIREKYPDKAEELVNRLDQMLHEADLEGE